MGGNQPPAIPLLFPCILRDPQQVGEIGDLQAKDLIAGAGDTLQAVGGLQEGLQGHGVDQQDGADFLALDLRDAVGGQRMGISVPYVQNRRQECRMRPEEILPALAQDQRLQRPQAPEELHCKDGILALDQAVDALQIAAAQPPQGPCVQLEAAFAAHPADAQAAPQPLEEAAHQRPEDDQPDDGQDEINQKDGIHGNLPFAAHFVAPIITENG